MSRYFCLPAVLAACLIPAGALAYTPASSPSPSSMQEFSSQSILTTSGTPSYNVSQFFYKDTSTSDPLNNAIAATRIHKVRGTGDTCRGVIILAPSYSFNSGEYFIDTSSSFPMNSLAGQLAQDNWDVVAFSPRSSAFGSSSDRKDGTCGGSPDPCADFSNWGLQVFVDDVAFLRKEVDRSGTDLVDSLCQGTGTKRVIGGLSMGGMITIEVLNQYGSTYPFDAAVVWDAVLWSKNKTFQSLQGSSCQTSASGYATLGATTLSSDIASCIGASSPNSTAACQRLVACTSVDAYGNCTTDTLNTNIFNTSSASSFAIPSSTPMSSPFVFFTPAYVSGSTTMWQAGTFAYADWGLLQQLWNPNGDSMTIPIDPSDYYASNAVMNDLNCAGSADPPSSVITNLGNYTGKLLFVEQGRGLGMWMPQNSAPTGTDCSSSGASSSVCESGMASGISLFSSATTTVVGPNGTTGAPNNEGHLDGLVYLPSGSTTEGTNTILGWIQGHVD